jgi:hypothetical protein
MRRVAILVGLVAACTLEGDATASWTETILEDAQPQATARGFDGIGFGYDESGNRIVCSGAEQGGEIWLGAVDGSYSTLVGTNQGSEDVMCGVDFDGNGYKDVASASEGQNRIRIFLKQSNGTYNSSDLTYTPVGDTTAQAWIKLDIADVNCDGTPDLLAGGKRISSHDATWGWWSYSAGTWTYHDKGQVGWAMQLQAIDWDGDSPCRDDVFITDKVGAGALDANKGAWIWINDGAGNFIGTQIHHLSGEPEFGAARDLDFDDDIDLIYGNRTTIDLIWNNGNGTYTVEGITKPSNTGDYHATILCPDTTGDGPFIMTFALSTGTETGVLMLRRNGASWDVTDISGASGAAGVTRKWDNGWCGFDGAYRLFVVSEGGDATGSDDKGIVKFTSPIGGG